MREVGQVETSCSIKKLRIAYPTLIDFRIANPEERGKSPSGLITTCRARCSLKLHHYIKSFSSIIDQPEKFLVLLYSYSNRII
jgi:hypothetical protein